MNPLASWALKKAQIAELHFIRSHWHIGDIEPTLESAKQDCMEVAQDHAATVPVIIRGQC